MPPINLNRAQRKSLPGHVRLANSMKLAYEQNPILPIVVHTIERGLRGSTSTGELDKAFANALKKYPRTSKERLQKFVEAYKQLDSNLKAKIVPQTLRNLDLSQPLPPSVYKNLPKQPVAITPQTVTPRNLSAKGFAAKFKDVFVLPPKTPILTSVTKDLASSTNNEILPEGGIIQGQYLSQKPSKNKISIYVRGREIDSHYYPMFFVASIFPEKVVALGGTPNQLALFFKLPPNFSELVETALGGLFFLDFELDVTNLEANLTSERIGFRVFTEPVPPPPPLPKPEIHGILPLGQTPGKKVIVTGKNFSYYQYPIFSFTPLDGQPYENMGLGNGQKINVLSDTQIELTLPIGWWDDSNPKWGRAIPGGNYSIQIGNSNAFVYNISPCTYKVIFERMHAIDVQDEGLELDPDEIVTQWVIAADNQAWSKQSRTYKGFLDYGLPANVETPLNAQPYDATDQSVFRIDGQAGPVEKGLVIRTRLWEWDSDDVASSNQEIGFIGDLVVGVLTVTGNGQYAVYVEWGVKVIQWFNSLWAAPDNLGERDLSFSAAALQGKTNNASHSFNGVIQFLNDDETGSYELFYRIVRIA